MLAVFGESLGPAAAPPLPELVEELQELVRARQAATAEATALTNRLGASQAGFLKRELARPLKALKAQIARLDDEIERRLAEDGPLARLYPTLMSNPGIRPVAAAQIRQPLRRERRC